MNLLVLFLTIGVTLTAAKQYRFRKHAKREAEAIAQETLNNYKPQYADAVPSAANYEPGQYNAAIPQTANTGSHNFVAKPVTENAESRQDSTQQILDAFQQSLDSQKLQQFSQPQYYQPAAAPAQLSQYPTNYYNLFGAQNQLGQQQLVAEGAEVNPVQHSTVVNHGPYTHLVANQQLQQPHRQLSTQPLQLTPRPNYPPLSLNLPQRQYVPSQAQFVPPNRSPIRQQSLVQQPLLRNVYQNPKIQQQPILPKPVYNYNPVPAVLNPYQPNALRPNSYQAPIKAPIQNIQLQPITKPMLAVTPQTFINYQNARPTPTPARENQERQNQRSESEEEDEESADEDEEEEERPSRYRNESEESADEEEDDTRYRPTFDAARYIFNEDKREREEDDEGGDNSRKESYVRPKPKKFYKYERPEKYGDDDEYNYRGSYKTKSRYNKPRKGDQDSEYTRYRYSNFDREPMYELQGGQSRNAPVAVRNQKLVEEKWLVAKKNRNDE